MNKLTILSGAALVALAGSGAAAAQGPEQRPDRNADVTRAQAIERSDRMFARLDGNSDGRLTPEDTLRQRAEQRRAARADRMFDRLDLDDNGSVTREEMAQARAQHQAQRAERRAEGGPGMRGPRGMRGRGGMGGGRAMRGALMFGEQGFVTAEQFRTRALERFDRADADRNGIVTAAERRQTRMQMRQQRRERRGQPG